MVTAAALAAVADPSGMIAAAFAVVVVFVILCRLILWLLG